MSLARHDQIARAFPANDRHMIPIFFWDRNVPPHVLDMAEQTAILLFDSYIGFTITQNNMQMHNVPRIHFLRRLIQSLLQQLPWAPNIDLVGVNITTPMIDARAFWTVSCVPMQHTVHGAHTFTMDRLHMTLC